MNDDTTPEGMPEMPSPFNVIGGRLYYSNHQLREYGLACYQAGRAAVSQVLIDYAEGRIEHKNRGYCPESNGHGLRDSTCPVCRALIEATR